MKAFLLLLVVSPAFAQVVIQSPALPPSLALPTAPTLSPSGPGNGLLSPSLQLAPSLTLPAPLPKVQPLTPAQPASPGPAVPAIPSQGAGPVTHQASKAELDFAAQASAALAAVADDMGAERGNRSSKMTGKDFLDLISEARGRYEELYKAQAPSPEALAAARSIQDQLLRVAAALLKPDQPLNGQVRRLLSVWNVFNQEMVRVSEDGTLEAIEAEAKLFADQVEQSV